MSWFRVGDTAATDPRILALEDPRDPTMGTLCFGFLVKLGTQSANHFTDYVIHPGFLALAGGPAAPKLLKRCIAAGLIIPLGGRGTGRRWKLIDTAPELFHIRLQAEVAWEKHQKADTRNPVLQEPVLLRDGDACRWCGIPVQPSDTRSRRGRHFDHLYPGQSARGPQDLVVACRGCNSARGRDQQEHPEETAEEFAARWAPRLRPPPRQLFFVRPTVDWLTESGHTIPAGSVIAERAPVDDGRPTTSSSTTTAPATHPVNAGVAKPPQQAPEPAGHRALTATHTAPAEVAAAESRTDQSATKWSGAGRVGDGSGLVGSGGSPPTRAAPDRPPSEPPTATARRRTRRGRRRSSSGGSSAPLP